MFRLLVVLMFLVSTIAWSQVLVINELDANDASSDDEEFIELKSQTPNFSTDGYVLVFFNGNNTSAGNNLSYLAFDLTGYSTDNNGLLVLGNLNVSPFPQVLINDGLFQNGPDAVAIYQASIFDFPAETPATMTNLIDALVYDTGGTSPVDNDLLLALGETVQYNEGSNVSNSLQRISDGTYVSAPPSSRRFNEGTTVLNPIAIAIPQEQYNEGESFTITFTAEENVTSNLTFTISLDNAGFTTADYSGVTTLTIPSGQNSASTQINILDDTDDEGDEVLQIQFLDLVEPIVAFNNLVAVRVIDNDFTVAPFGTPLSPTRGNVSSTQPNGYYDSLNGLAGNALRQAIQDIIADPSTVRAHSYADIFEILNEADQNPENSNQVWLVYTEEGRSKLNLQTGSSSAGKWNREHTFPRSRGGFNDWDDFDDIADGISAFITTEADSLRHANSDAHALRAADASENSRRGNRHYSNTQYDSDEYNGPSDAGNQGSWKGDVARGVLFLELRYNGLQIVNGFPASSPTGNLGDLATLLQWHADDAPDDYEMNRNNVIYNWQRNRNPLIDMPELVDYIWGSRVGETWFNTLSTEQFNSKTVVVYPNPASDRVYVSGINASSFNAEVYTLEGRLIKRYKSISEYIPLNVEAGMYLLKLTFQDKMVIKKISVLR